MQDKKLFEIIREKLEFLNNTYKLNKVSISNVNSEYNISFTGRKDIEIDIQIETMETNFFTYIMITYLNDDGSQPSGYGYYDDNGKEVIKNIYKILEENGIESNNYRHEKQKLYKIYRSKAKKKYFVNDTITKDFKIKLNNKLRRLFKKDISKEAMEYMNKKKEEEELLRRIISIDKEMLEKGLAAMDLKT